MSLWVCCVSVRFAGPGQSSRRRRRIGRTYRTGVRSQRKKQTTKKGTTSDTRCRCQRRQMQMCRSRRERAVTASLTETVSLLYCVHRCHPPVTRRTDVFSVWGVLRTVDDLPPTSAVASSSPFIHSNRYPFVYCGLFACKMQLRNWF